MNKKKSIKYVALFFILLLGSFTNAKEIKDIFSYFDLTKDQVISKLGNDYEIVNAGIEGADQGYLYEKIGITIVFSGDEVSYIDCSNKVTVKGVKTGMKFSQIQKKLGKSPIIETFIENESNRAYVINYRINDNLLLQFISYCKDGKDSFLTIYRIYDPTQI